MNDKKKIQKPYPISWEQLHRDARALAWRLLEKDFFTGIVAVTRGGLVPAAIIARELDIHMVETVCIAGYDWQEHRGEPEVLKAPDMDGSGWLLVDDLVDSGQTAALVRKTLPRAYFACIYAKPSGRPQVDCYVTEVSQDTWILFPWDMESRFVEPLAGNI